MRFLRSTPRPVAAAGGFALLAALYTRLSLQSVINSDGANEALQGLAFWQGNPLLHGWWLAQDTFYLTDAPLYGLIARVQGLGPWVVHEGAGIVYALAVVLAALLARRGALITAAVLALPPALLLQGQMHILGVAYVLAALLLTDRAPDSRWAWAAAALLVVAAMASDPLVSVLFAPAIGMVAAVRFLMAPAASDRLRSGALVVIAVAGALATWALPELIALLGGFERPRPLHVGVVTPADLPANLHLGARGLLLVFGADVFDGRPDALVWIRLLAVAAAAAGVVLGARRWRDRGSEDLVFQVVLVAALVDVAAFVFSSQAYDLASSRFLSPFAICAAILAGRELGPALESRRLRAAALPLAAVLLATPAVALSRPAAAIPTAPLERWLLARGLTHGVGSYWEAGIVTLDTGGRVTVRCVDGPRSPGRRATPDRWFQSSAWFTPDPASPARFVVFVPGEHTANIDEAGDRRAFGAPVEIDRVGPYEVMLYSRDLLLELAR